MLPPRQSLPLLAMLLGASLAPTAEGGGDTPRRQPRQPSACAAA